MKHSKIEKAIVLSLLLSSSLYGTVSAEERISEPPTTEEFPLLDNQSTGIYNPGLSHHYTGEDVNIDIVKNNMANTGISYGAWTYAEGYKGKTVIDVNSLNINIKNNVYLLGGYAGDYAVGIFAGPAKDVGNHGGSNTIITAENSINLDVQTRNAQNGYGVYSQKNDNISLKTNSGDITINTSKSLFRYNDNMLIDRIEDANYENSNIYGVNTEEGSINFNATGNIKIKSFISDTSDLSSINGYGSQIDKLQKGDIYAVNNEKGNINLQAGNNIELTAEANEGKAYGIYTNGVNGEKNNILNANSNIITATSKKGEAHAIYADNSNVELIANNGVNCLESTGNGITADNNSNISFDGNTYIEADKNGIELTNGSQSKFNNDLMVLSSEGKSIHLSSGANLNVKGNTVIDSEFVIEGNDTKGIIDGSLSGFTNKENAVVVKDNGTLNIGSNIGIEGADKGLVVTNGRVTVDNKNGYGTNFILGENGAIKATENADISLNGNTFIANGNENSSAIEMDNSKFASDGPTTIIGAKDAITANNSNITLSGKFNSILAGQKGFDEENNSFYDGRAIDATSDGKTNSKVDVFGTNNLIGGTVLASGKSTEVNIGKDDYNSQNNIYAKTHVIDEVREDGTKNHIVSAVYAKDGATINLNGTNDIRTLANSGHSDDKERTVWAEKGTININGQANIHASNGSIEKPNNVGIAIAAGGVEGADVDAPHDAFVNANLKGGSYIFGDILAGAKGQVDLNVNQLMPLADNNMSAEGITIQGNILAANGGAVNANLGANSVLTGRIDSYMDANPQSDHGNKFFAPEFSNDIIDAGKVSLSLGDNSRWNVVGQSWVTDVNIEGEGTVIDLVSANATKNDHAHALTIENLNGDANFKMSLKGDEDNSYATDMIYIKNGNGEFNVAVDEVLTENDITDAGLRFATIGNGSKVNFKNVGTYNAGAFNVLYTVEKSGYDVNDTENNNRYNGKDFSEDKPGSDNINNFFTPEEKSMATLSTETKESDESAIATNYNIVGIASRELNNIGKTIINLSRANYANAVYMDNMNQRLGEARYLEGNEGFWVKLGHNSIGKDNAFDIDNNVYQLGYDKLHQEENGARRIGVVADYMTGDTSYDNISANGEVSRKGLWLYDTWTGNDGHYTDFVAKWGHLKNNFDIYVPDRDVVNGEYNNDVFALSGEYGYKKSLGNNWYIEPQIQLQYAYITGADYMTSQDTNVRLDAINSLISRAGFRLGREFGKDNKTNLYLKGNIMHEFLGDQDIRTWDDTGVLNGTFDNDGTWYNIGIGVSTMLSDSSYAYVDYEKSFGNDNDNTYQVNGGVRWAF